MRLRNCRAGPGERHELARALFAVAFISSTSVGFSCLFHRTALSVTSGKHLSNSCGNIQVNTFELELSEQRSFCRRLIFGHGVAEEDLSSFNDWVTRSGAMVSQFPPAPRPLLTTRDHVSLNFSFGNLFAFQNLSKSEAVCTHRVRGLVFAHRDWWFTAHAHFIYEHLPVIAWLRSFMKQHVESNESKISVTLLLDYIPSNIEFMKFFDAEFEKSILWVKPGQTVCIDGTIVFPAYAVESIKDPNPTKFSVKTASWTPGTFAGRPPPTWRTFGHPTFVELARLWVLERSEHIVKRPLEPIVLYHKRHRSAASNGRLMDAENDSLLLQSVQEGLRTCGRSEKVVIYTGVDSEGRTLSHQEQFLLFHAASLFISPHSGAVANILFLPTPRRKRTSLADESICQSRPQVIEYIAGPRSAHVQWAFASYYSLYFSPTWAEYHVVQFSQNSTSAVTQVPVDEWHQALFSIFSGKRCPANRTL